MKKVLSILLGISLWYPSVGQQHKLGLTSTYGMSEPFLGGDGGASYDVGSYYNIGILYEKGLSNSWKFETGLVWSKYQTSKTYIDYFSPNLNKVQYDLAFQAVQIPVNFKFVFLNYLFLNAGIIANLQLDQKAEIKTSGIGANIGFGAKYDFKQGHTIFANPYISTQNIIHLNNSRIGIFEIGLRIGFLYAF